MNTAKKLSQMRRTAARVLAKAVLDFSPKAYTVRGGETRWGFFFDFVLSHPFSRELLPLIEERMRAIVVEDLAIQIHEMVPSNAAKWMRHHGFFYPAHFVERGEDPLVQVIQIDNFLDGGFGSFLTRTKELKAFKLLKMERRPDLDVRGSRNSVYRIAGVADVGEKELKVFLRKNKESIERDHLSIGKEMGIFEVVTQRNSDGVEIATLFWKKRGEALLHALYSFWRKRHLAEGFELIVTPPTSLKKDPETLLTLFGKDLSRAAVRFAECLFPNSNTEFCPIDGLLKEGACPSDRSYIFCLEKELRSSLSLSLNFLSQVADSLEWDPLVQVFCPKEWEEWFSKLPFKGSLYPSKTIRVEWTVRDCFGKNWQGPFLKVKKKGAIFIIEQSFFGSIERLIALILERKEKDLSQKKELLSKLALCDD